MSVGRLFRRPLNVLLGLCCLGLALLGGIALNGAAVFAVVALAATVAAVAATAQREHRAAVGWMAGGGAAAVVMVGAGIGVLAGAGVAVFVAGPVVGVVVVGWAVRCVRPRWACGTFGSHARPGTQSEVAPLVRSVVMDAFRTPITQLSLSQLGAEWRWTTGALATPLTGAVLQAVVQRRADLLDEFERRDPAGFELWLAAGTPHDSDPTEFVGRGGGCPHAD